MHSPPSETDGGGLFPNICSSRGHRSGATAFGERSERLILSTFHCVTITFAPGEAEQQYAFLQQEVQSEGELAGGQPKNWWAPTRELVVPRVKTAHVQGLTTLIES